MVSGAVLNVRDMQVEMSFAYAMCIGNTTHVTLLVTKRSLRFT